MTQVLRFIRFQSLLSKLIGMSLIILIVPSFIIGYVSFNVAHNQLNEASKIALRNNVQLVNYTIDILNQEVQEGKVTLADAQEQVKDMVLGKQKADGTRPINPNYNIGNNRGYIFIVDKHGVIVANPTLADGKNAWDVQDSTGYKFVQAMINSASNGGGFTTYVWPEAGHPNQLQDKITYAADAPAWGWVVADGSYIQRAVQQMNEFTLPLSS